MSHVLSKMLTPGTRKAHRGTWFVWSGGQKLRHQANMRGMWGWDVECSCGQWASRTGGATRGSVEDAFWDHRYSAQVEAESKAEARADGVDADDLRAYMAWLRDKLASDA